MPAATKYPRNKASRAATAAEWEEKEAHLQQAAAEYNAGEHQSLGAAAAANHVPEATLRHRLKGRKPKRDAATDLQALSPASESALVDFIRGSSAGAFLLAPLMSAAMQNPSLGVFLGARRLSALAVPGCKVSSSGILNSAHAGPAASRMHVYD